MEREELKKHFDSRMEPFTKLQDLRTNDAPDGEVDDCHDEINNRTLCIDVYFKLTVLLGFGGPSDGFDLYFDCHGEYMHGCYWYQWAAPKQEWDLMEDEAEMILSAYGLDDPYSVKEFIQSKGRR